MNRLLPLIVAILVATVPNIISLMLEYKSGAFIRGKPKGPGFISFAKRAIKYWIFIFGELRLRLLRVNS